MSMSALLQAVRNTIRSEMDIENGMCRIMPGPKPPPSCGQRFYSVFGSEWTAGDFDLNLGIDESFGISIATTFRAGFAPWDDHGEELYIKAISSIEARTRTLITLITAAGGDSAGDFLDSLDSGLDLLLTLSCGSLTLLGGFGYSGISLALILSNSTGQGTVASVGTDGSVACCPV